MIGDPTYDMTDAFPTTHNLDTLIERVEKASGPDRELDSAICLALDFPPSVEKWGSLETPTYTASLDAAIELVERVLPDANCYGVEKEPDTWSAYVSRNNVNAGHWLQEAYHKTGPLALLLALLKRRALLSERSKE